MSGVWRWGRTRDGGWESPPGLTADAPDVAAQVADVDRQLLALALIPKPYWSPTTRARMDRLLDLRNAIHPLPPLDLVWPPLRPSVPVIPGRSS